MQNNISVHLISHFLNWLKAENVYTKDWPTKLANLNTIENVWKKLCCVVYPYSRQLGNVNELGKAIENCRFFINRAYIQKLY